VIQPDRTIVGDPSVIEPAEPEADPDGDPEPAKLALAIQRDLARTTVP
jgi:hypothetical protein